jgi:hypothetical protein
MIGGYLLSLITMVFYLFIYLFKFIFNISELEAPPIAMFLIYISESKNRVLWLCGEFQIKGP